MSLSFHLIRRAAALPPVTLARILRRKVRFRIDARRLPAFAATLDADALLERMGSPSLDSALANLAKTPPFPRPTPVPDEARDGVVSGALAVRDRVVDLLGSGPTSLGSPIDWLSDFKTGIAWPLAPMNKIAVNRLDEPCDIKVPWDLSRLQWLMPAAQAWRISGSDHDARAVREIIEDWIDGNPIAAGPNWVCAMDVALRGVSLVWLATQCLDAPSWRDETFRQNLLKTLWLHGCFVERHLEWADVNGNHLLADALGLVVIGAALPGSDAARWHSDGWRLLVDQLSKQVNDDGGSFEVSSAYHRFVLEMAVVAATVRTIRGHTLEPQFAETLRRMADFLSALIRGDGTLPNWGDADDGRVIPIGPAPLETASGIATVAYRLAGDPQRPPAPSEIPFVFWLSGQTETGPSCAPCSRHFAETGAVVLRGPTDHVFVDVGRVGMNGRGGHGHNDCLSFEAVLDGAHIVCDPGTYVYTADADARNHFRSTAAHNTPLVDGADINRLVAPNALWMLHDDTTPSVEMFDPGTSDGAHLVASHDGYMRLSDPVQVRRSIVLDTELHALGVLDQIEAIGEHHVSVRITVPAGVTVSKSPEGAMFDATSGDQSFRVVWLGDDWSASIEPAYVSPSYGRRIATQSIVFSCQTTGRTQLGFSIAPSDAIAVQTIRRLVPEATRSPD